MHGRALGVSHQIRVSILTTACIAELVLLRRHAQRLLARATLHLRKMSISLHLGKLLFLSSFSQHLFLRPSLPTFSLHLATVFNRALFTTNRVSVLPAIILPIDLILLVLFEQSR